MKMMTRGRCTRRPASSHAPVGFLKLSMASLESTLRQRDPSFMMPILLVAVEPNRGLFVVTQTASGTLDCPGWVRIVNRCWGPPFGGDRRNLKIDPIPTCPNNQRFLLRVRKKK